MVNVAACGVFKKLRDRWASNCILLRGFILSDVSKPAFMFVLAHQSHQYHKICAGGVSAEVFGRDPDETSRPCYSALLSQTSRKYLLVILLAAVTKQRES
jgi:hypothetical protein